MKIAGKIIPLPRGEYDAEATYSILDLVTYNNRLYILKEETAQGVLPTEEDTWIMLIDVQTKIESIDTAISEKVTQVNNTLETINQAISSMTNTVNTCNTAVTKCTEKVSDMERRINGLVFNVNIDTGDLEYTLPASSVSDETNIDAKEME